jgi:hypothetical protein
VPLFLALSCLQGRPRGLAVAQLRALGPDGLQLCPGNPPGDIDLSGLQVRFHHGWSATARLRPVHDAGGRPHVGGRDWSLHPPQAAASGWMDAMGEIPVETMYPGEALGTGVELDEAMDRGLNLAVDVSHLYIQRCAGVLGDATLRRLWGYDRVVEVHVSANDGRADAHQPLRADTFGLAWARERAAAGTPLVLECWMHALDEAARVRQVALCRGEA